MNFLTSLARFLRGAVCGSALAFCTAANSADIVGIDFHGSLSLTTSYSGKYNFLGDTRTGPDLNVVEGILNAQHRFDCGLRAAAQVYAYQLDDYTAIDLDYGNLSYSFTDWFGISVGRNKLPLGLYNEIQDIDMVHPFAFLPLANYPKDLRAFFASYDGLGIFGTINLGKAGGIDYKAYAGWRSPVDKDAPLVQSFPGVSKIDVIEPGFLYGGSLFYNTPIQGLRFGVSAAVLPNIKTSGVIRNKKEQSYQAQDHRDVGEQVDRQFNDTLAAAGLSAPMVEFLYGSDYSYWDSTFAGHRETNKTKMQHWKFSAEYAKDAFTLALEYGRQTTDSIGGGLLPGRTYEASDGIVALATWKVSTKWELGGYLDFKWNNQSNRDGRKFSSLPRSAAYTRDYAVAASYNVTDWWNLKAEYHFIDGTGLLRNTSNENGDPSSWSSHWNLFVLKSTFSF